MGSAFGDVLGPSLSLGGHGPLFPAAGATPAVADQADARPAILVFDSGVGGLTVFREVARVRPDARLTYVADVAAFPYGALADAALVARVDAVLGAMIARHAPALVVIACSTASTLVLPHLRARHPDVQFVGTVPAVKPACERSATKIISVLATPGTVRRDYTRALVQDFAGPCRVTLVGSPVLAGLAEAFLRGFPIEEDAVAAEIRPCFVEADGLRTDTVVLACTHYPLLLDLFEALAPWPVTWLDPAPAIARRVVQLLGPAPPVTPAGGSARAVFTAGPALGATLAGALKRFGLSDVEIASVATAGQGI